MAIKVQQPNQPSESSGKLILKLGIILMVITAVASGGLAMLNRVTDPIIRKNEAEKEAKARREVTASLKAETFEADSLFDGTVFYRAYDDSSHLVGYVTTVLGSGYSSKIKTVAGFDLVFNITGLKVIFQQETPGLGTKVTEIKKGDDKPWFLAQFEGKDALNVAVVQDRGQIDSITGATITSRAVSNSIKLASRKLSAELVTEQPVIEELKDNETDAPLTEGGEVKEAVQ